MKLYGFPPSPNTWQVRALAAYLGVPLEFESVDLPKGGSRTPAFLAINPTGRTPVLVDGDFKLWETTAIMQYVAGKLLQTNADEAASVDKLIDAAQANADRLASAAAGIGTKLDISV